MIDYPPVEIGTTRVSCFVFPLSFTVAKPVTIGIDQNSS